LTHYIIVIARVSYLSVGSKFNAITGLISAANQQLTIDNRVWAKEELTLVKDLKEEGFVLFEVDGIYKED